MKTVKIKYFYFILYLGVFVANVSSYGQNINQPQDIVNTWKINDHLNEWNNTLKAEWEHTLTLANQSGFAENFQKKYSPWEQKQNWKKFNSTIKTIHETLESKSLSDLEKKHIIQLLLLDSTDHFLPISRSSFNEILKSGILKMYEELKLKARLFEPNISDADIFQAFRNVWTANSIQILLGKEVSLSPSIFAYSMLYPLTDNFLDNMKIAKEKKIAFVKIFGKRLAGITITPQTVLENQVSQLVSMIEAEWPRNRYPNVYQSLLAIHQAQILSMEQTNPATTLNRLLEISIFKGGSSVLADAFLVAGDLDTETAFRMYRYGFLLQLTDDLQDFISDLIEGHQSIFVKQSILNGTTKKTRAKIDHTGRRVQRISHQQYHSIKPIDRDVIRLFLYTEQSINETFLSRNTSDADQGSEALSSETLYEIFKVGLNFLNIQSIVLQDEITSKNLRFELEKFSPLSFSNLDTSFRRSSNTNNSRYTKEILRIFAVE